MFDLRVLKKITQVIWIFLFPYFIAKVIGLIDKNFFLTIVAGVLAIVALLLELYIFLKNKRII